MEQPSGVRTDKSRVSIVRSIQDQLHAGEEIRAVLPFTQTSKRPRMPGRRADPRGGWRDQLARALPPSCHHESAAPLCWRAVEAPFPVGFWLTSRGTRSALVRSRPSTTGPSASLSICPASGLFPFEAGRKEHDEALENQANCSVFRDRGISLSTMTARGSGVPELLITMDRRPASDASRRRNESCNTPCLRCHGDGDATRRGARPSRSFWCGGRRNSTASTRLRTLGVPRLLLVGGGSPARSNRAMRSKTRSGSPRPKTNSHVRVATLASPTHGQSRARSRRSIRTDCSDTVAAWSPLSDRTSYCGILVDRFGDVVDYETLVRITWKGRRPTRNALDVLIKRLRRRIAPSGLEICTVRGRGYIFQNVDASGVG